ncbi:MAG: transposase [Gammaproteobacteria bacterium]|nr:transposase [Gammaproteobacteria bacterium]
MQGRQAPQRELFCTINLEEFIPKDHLLYRLDKVVNFDFIYELTKGLYCADNGRASIDPVLFFRMQLVSYLYGMKSDRELCREVHLNLAYRWFCRLGLHEVVPDHSSMTRIRDRFGEATFTKIFDQLIARWQEAGHIRGRRIVADASLVEADAAVDSLVERDDADPNARALKDYERRYHDFKIGKRHRKRTINRLETISSIVRTNVHATRAYRLLYITVSGMFSVQFSYYQRLGGHQL